MLIIIGPDLQLGSVCTIRLVAGEFLGFGGRLGIMISFYGTPTAWALEDFAVSSQFLAVVRRDLVRWIIGFILDRHYFYSEHRSGNIHVGTIIVFSIVFNPGLRARINGETGLAGVHLGMHVEAAEWSIDVNFLFALFVFHTHIAGDKQDE